MITSAPTSAQQNITWTKTGNGAWGNSSNWSCNCVPTAADTVTIEHDSVIIPNGLHALAAEVVVNDDALAAGLAVLAGGSLTIVGSARNGLSIKGSQATFRNDGLVKISHTVGDGILLISDAIFDNRSGAQIQIDSVGNAGILQNSPNFTNSGKIEISQCVSSGIFSRAHFSNGDSIIMSYCEGLNLTVLGQNSGTIIVDSTWSSSGLSTRAQFDNSGYLHVSRIARNGIESGGGAFTNDGTIHIADVMFRGLNHESPLVNNGVINIQKTGSHGIAAEDLLTNHGKVFVENAAANGISLIGSQADFDNNDSVMVSNCTVGITVDESTFSNFGYYRTTSHTQTGIAVNEGLVENTGELVSISAVENLCIAASGRVQILDGILACINGAPNIQVKAGGTLDVSTSGEIEALFGMVPLTIEVGGVFNCDGILTTGSAP